MKKPAVIKAMCANGDGLFVSEISKDGWTGQKELANAMRFGSFRKARNAANKLAKLPSAINDGIWGFMAAEMT